jgi:DNA-binding XRE family transcriptional regulator/quercetin dioxygenase-like cupin family protein
VAEVAGGAFNPGAELGPRLRRVREERGLSARELARRISCSPSLVSQIERGVSAPSVGMLYALATELRTSLDFLFGVGPGSPPGPDDGPGPGDGATPGGADGSWPAGHGIVQRAASRRTIDLASGVRWERLTPGADEHVDFLEVVYEPGGHSTDMRRALRHDGYEYGLIMSGTLQARVGFESYVLGPGDSIAFDSATPHEYWNNSPDEVHGVWAVVHRQPGRP